MESFDFELSLQLRGRLASIQQKMEDGAEMKENYPYKFNLCDLKWNFITIKILGCLNILPFDIDLSNQTGSGPGKIRAKPQKKSGRQKQHLKMSSSQSSDTAKGGEWKWTLYYTRDATKSGGHLVKVSDKDLKDFFAKEGAGDDPIRQVWIYKHNLGSVFVPKWFGLWHEFMVVWSKNWFWSFEKDSKGIRVQRSKNLHSVKGKYRGESRTGFVELKGRKSEEVERHGEKMQDIFDWIYYWDYLNEKYDVLESNCQDFASELFDAVARQKGRKLRRN